MDISHTIVLYIEVGKRYYFCAQYCKDTFDANPSEYQEADTSDVEDVEEVSTIAVDPICKMDVDVATANLISEYQDKKYYFCAQYCKDTFDSNPEPYKDQDRRP
ncbi:MAG: YHS domain-containing protein [Candidatus Thorarchaeota archaeon]